jgi:hypothetical protein
VKGLTAGKSLTPAMLRRGDFLEFIRKEAVPAAKESFGAPAPGGAAGCPGAPQCGAT